MAKASTPTSARMTAVTPASSSSSNHWGRRAISSLRGMVLHVTCRSTPRSRQSFAARRSSSGEKFPAKERMPNVLPARYTASAP